MLGKRVLCCVLWVIRSRKEVISKTSFTWNIPLFVTQNGVWFCWWFFFLPEKLVIVTNSAIWKELHHKLSGRWNLQIMSVSRGKWKCKLDIIYSVRNIQFINWALLWLLFLQSFYIWPCTVFISKNIFSPRVDRKYCWNGIWEGSLMPFAGIHWSQCSWPLQNLGIQHIFVFRNFEG